MRCKAITAAVWIGMAAMTQTGLAQQSRMATEAGATTQASAASASKINAILDRWQGVEASKGGNVALWRDIMNIQLKHVSPSTLDRLLALNVGDNAADKAQFYQSFVHVLGTDIALRLLAQKNRANTQSTANASSEAANAEYQRRVKPQFLGDTTDDQTFIPITPCRIVDTRNVGGPIASFAARNFFFYTTDGTFNWFSNQGGVSGQASSTCPATVFGYVPSAAIATVTVTGQGGGNLVVWGRCQSGRVRQYHELWRKRRHRQPRRRSVGRAHRRRSGGLDWSTKTSSILSATIPNRKRPHSTAFWTAPVVTNILRRRAAKPRLVPSATLDFRGSCYMNTPDASIVDSGAGSYFPVFRDGSASDVLAHPTLPRAPSAAAAGPQDADAGKISVTRKVNVRQRAQRGFDYELKTMQAALLIGMAVLTSEVVAAGQTTIADARSTRFLPLAGGSCEQGRQCCAVARHHEHSVETRSPSTLDRLLALNVGDNAAVKARFYLSLVHVLEPT